MNLPTLPLTLLAWSEQVFVLTAVVALAALAIAHPKARLLLWQGLLLVLVLLPVIEPWKSPPLEVATQTTMLSFASVSTAASPVRFHWRTEDWLWLIGAGAALRLIWVAAGFLRLGRYRKQARLLVEPPLRFASDAARWYASDSVPGPVTYGWRRPVILLPAQVLELPADLREAIQCHELIHVRRGDWLFVLGETLVRSLLWFHPAIWFVLSRIQLSREQVVDQEAVGLLQNRERYLDALVAVAESQLLPDLAPAPLFLRKRHLAERVEAVVKEIDMTRSKMITGAALVCSALPIAACAAMWLFPFVSQAQTAPDSPGVTVDAGAVLLHRAPVRAPAGSVIAGTVILQATIDSKGEVTDARVISGPEELRKEALSSVLQWHYRPGTTLAQVSIRFDAPPPAPAPPASTPAASVGVIGGRGGAPISPRAVPATSSNGTLKSIEFAGISPEAEQELRSRIRIREGDIISREDMQSVSAAVREFDSHLDAAFTLRSTSDTTLRIAPGRALALAVAPPPPPPPPAPGETGAYRPGPSNGVLPPVPISRVEPQYTEEARRQKWTGSVRLSTVIDESGIPTGIKVLEPLGLGLDEKAIEALSQWRFKPGTKDGAPVKVQAQIEIMFRLL